MVIKFKLDNKSTSYVNIPCTYYSKFAMYLHRYKRGDATDKWAIEVGHSGISSGTIGYFSSVEEAQRVLDEIAKCLVDDRIPWFDVDLFLSKGRHCDGVNVYLPHVNLDETVMTVDSREDKDANN